MFFVPINAEQYPLRKTKETDIINPLSWVMREKKLMTTHTV